MENLKRFNQENKAITRESIEISLLQLLEKKDFKKITISELVERAGVSRAAFYRNYGSKEEILKSIFESSIAKITKSLDGYNLKTDLYQVWVYLLKEVKKEAKIISLAIDYNFEQVLTKAVYDFLEKSGKLLLRKTGTLKSCQIIPAFCKNDLKNVGYIVTIILGRNWFYYQIYVEDEK